MSYALVTMADKTDSSKVGNWQQLLQLLYGGVETFLLRDLIGYIGPGSLLIIGLAMKLSFEEMISSEWPEVALLVIASYITATGLRLLGHCFRICVFHRPSGVFGRVVSQPTVGSGFLEFLWRVPETHLQEAYSEFNKKQHLQCLSREEVFMHITGITGMALFVFGVVESLTFVKSCWWDLQCEMWPGILKCLKCLLWFAVSAIFLLGHYVHAYQADYLRQHPPTSS